MKSKLIDGLWRYTHTYDRKGKILKLDKSGRIFGHIHENEYYWSLEDEFLIFKTSEGVASVKFDISDFDVAGGFAQGEFMLWADSGMKAFLAEAADYEILGGVSAYDVADIGITVVPETQVEGVESGYGKIGAYPIGYSSKRVDLLFIKNAIVINKYGVVYKNNHIINESLFHFPFFLHLEFVCFPDARYGKVKKAAPIHVRRAIHAFEGVSGNYYHWMMLFICKIGFVAEKIAPDKEFVILLPEYLNKVQSDSAEIVARYYGLSVVNINSSGSVEVDELMFPHHYGSEGLDPSPITAKTFSIIKNSFPRNFVIEKKRIYISRSDSTFRRLENENDVESFLLDQGYIVVSLSNKSLEEQVSLLSSASVVISPHGAGMTNIGFCEEGTKILEFQSPSHINWCMKNIAEIARLKYGCLIGIATAEDRYVIDMHELSEAVIEIGIGSAEADRIAI